MEYTFKPYQSQGVGFFRAARGVQSGTGLGFLDAILSAVGSAAGGVAGAFAQGAVAGEQTKQAEAAAKTQQEIAKANTQIAMLQAQADIVRAQSRAQSLSDIMPWVGVGVVGLGLLVVLAKKA